MGMEAGVREPQRSSVRSQELTLNVLTLGRSDAPALVMVHGIRDMAMSLVPIADRLANDYFVVVPDLRGHGDSDKPGHYAMHQFVYDLHRVSTALGLARPHVVGHSLGGQIAARYATLFPEHIASLVIAEGLGPPTRPRDAQFVSAAEAARLVATMQIPVRQRPLPSIEFAAERLLANNPRLTAEHAMWLAEHCTEIENGERHWKFDPRASEVWLGTDHEQTRAHWRAIQSPVLVITAGLAHEHWTKQTTIPGWDGRFTEEDLGARLACFAHVEHVHIADAGHMIHFDAPDAFAAVIRAFVT